VSIMPSSLKDDNMRSMLQLSTVVGKVGPFGKLISIPFVLEMFIFINFIDLPLNKRVDCRLHTVVGRSQLL
jgi:hypothetical protein